ncbi:MAG: hypothetical protein L0241_29325 [Planctomycetia bacterium]|nr:hypothetical protein [Planctomycetia bacterium]
MTTDTHITRRGCSGAAFCVVLALVALAGCKSTKDGAPGTGAGRGKDVLIAGPNLIPKQNVPVPERGIGTKGKPDPLLGNPTGKSGEKIGYSADPERFKGTYIPGKPSTPAALAGKIKDGEELKIETPGVKLVPVGGSEVPEAPNPAESLDPLYTELKRYGVESKHRSLVREDGQWVFRASVPLNGAGARGEYNGVGKTQIQAVKSVVEQIKTDRR